MNKTLLSRPIAVTMCIIALSVMGFLALRNIPVSLMPDIDIPQITVQVSMPGYSAQEIERNVVAPLRGRLMQVAGITDIRSESRMDAGSVKMTFNPGSGYEFNSKVIAKPLIARDLAIFLFSNFPTFSPHLQEFVQS